MYSVLMGSRDRRATIRVKTAHNTMLSNARIISAFSPFLGVSTQFCTALKSSSVRRQMPPGAPDMLFRPFMLLKGGLIPDGREGLVDAEADAFLVPESPHGQYTLSPAGRKTKMTK